MNENKFNTNQLYFDCEDMSEKIFSAIDLIPKNSNIRNRDQLAAKLANQLINNKYNRNVLNMFSINPSISYSGLEVLIKFHTSLKIGAFSLISPTTGKPDYGFVIKPRFGWKGLGPILSNMGWKVIPKPLTSLHLLPRSDRKIPSWVLSSIILFRIRYLLDNLTRRFNTIEEDLTTPRGRIEWNKYIYKNISCAKYIDLPCCFSELQNDIDLKSAIHYTLKKHLRSLEGQKTAGLVVLKLIDVCQDLLLKVKDVFPLIPSSNLFKKWLKIPMKNQILLDGLQAIEWTVEDKGFAGLSDLSGLPWILSMEEFFEAWLETIVKNLSYKIGGMVSTGRERQTINPISWDPPFTGSQHYLLPDIILEKKDEVIIFDAKYKEHFEEMYFKSWYNVANKVKEHHRNDLLQILAYSTLFNNKKITVCLTYPCKISLWKSLNERGRPFHKADISRGNRSIKIIIAAVPMGDNISSITNVLIDSFKS